MERLKKNNHLIGGVLARINTFIQYQLSVKKLFILCLPILLICLNLIFLSQPSLTQPKYNYGEALEKSILFYEAQQAGKLPEWNRVPWRGDAALNDGTDVGVDLTGGWFDAGDLVKFGFPLATTVTTLAWGGIEYYQAFQKSDQLIHLSRNIKWATDYILKAFVNEDPDNYVFYGQVGNGEQDHQWWGSAEVVDYEMKRPAYKIDTSCPGSELAAESAAALASSSILFRKNGDLDYADLLVEKAEKLYDFADRYRGKYSDCIADAYKFYRSYGGYQDELVWGAIWLHKAKKEQNSSYDDHYLAKAVSEYELMGKVYNYSLVFSDKSYGVYVLLAIETGESKYQKRAEKWLDYWTVGYKGERGKYTPGGLAFIDKWGCLRLAANTAFIGFVYNDWLRSQGLTEKVDRYQNFGISQINYILGDNPANRSYMTGFGNNPPQNPHHRTAHGSWLNNSNKPAENRNLLVGALVGGPDENDYWQDNRNDWVQTEVAIGYNAGLTGALAKMYLEFGGEPLKNISIPNSQEEQIYVETKIVNQGKNFAEIQADIVNKSASPAQALDNTSVRFFFSLDANELDTLKFSSPENECSNSPSQPTEVAENIYSVEISCQGQVIYPGGKSKYRKSILVRVEKENSNWFSSLFADSLLSHIKDNQVTLYEDGNLIWGQEPT